jgi:hypothetical protein
VFVILVANRALEDNNFLFATVSLSHFAPIVEHHHIQRSECTTPPPPPPLCNDTFSCPSSIAQPLITAFLRTRFFTFSHSDASGGSLAKGGQSGYFPIWD